MTVVEGLRAASSTQNLLNGGNLRSKQLPADTRQRLEDLARANTRPVSRSVSSSAKMAGSAPNLAGSSPPKRGQTILEENAAALAKLNNNGKTASVPSIAHAQSAIPNRAMNLKNGGDVSGIANNLLTLTAAEQQQQHLPTSLSSDPSKKVRPRSFWANWWRF